MADKLANRDQTVGLILAVTSWPTISIGANRFICILLVFVLVLVQRSQNQVKAGQLAGAK